jgi:hypothetical protein
MFRILAAVGCALLVLAGGAFASEGGETETKAIPFSMDPPLVLDIYMPDTITDTSPVLVLFHGGGWHVGGGSKDFFTNQGRAPAERGFSSGRYDAALLATDERSLEAEGVPRNGLSGTIGVAAGSFGVAEHQPHAFPQGDPEAWAPTTDADPQDRRC